MEWIQTFLVYRMTPQEPQGADIEKAAELLAELLLLALEEEFESTKKTEPNQT